MAYEVMNHQPEVSLNEKGIVLDKNTLKGEIKFENVNFTYPTRQDFQVLKNFSYVFEQGKTTALVGPSGSGKSTII